MRTKVKLRRSEVGRMGGEARAAAMPRRLRSKVAQEAARARWGSRATFDVPPASAGEVAAFVAYLDVRTNPDARAMVPVVLVSALDLVGGDPCLARMMPVFLWRNRECLGGSVDGAVRDGVRRRLLGYLLGVAARLGGGDTLLLRLSGDLRPENLLSTRTTMLFARAAENPFEVMKASMNPSPEALEWGFLVADTGSFFDGYFTKMVSS